MAEILLPGWTVPDLLYIAGTVAFFALMLLYVRFCLTIEGGAPPKESRHDD